MTHDDIDGLENEPVFICSQLRVGETLTQRDVDAIQAILSDLDKRENEDIDEFSNGREFGIREIGGEELLAAVMAKQDAYITKVVRETIAKMEAKTAEIKAATLPDPDRTPQPNRPLRLSDAENAEAGARAVSDILDKLAVSMDAPLNAIDRLRAFAGGSKDITFDPDDADEILEYLETLAATATEDGQP